MRRAALAALLVTLTTVSALLPTSSWIIIGGNGAIYSLSINTGLYSSIANCSWRGEPHVPLVLSGPMRAFNNASMIFYLAVSASPPNQLSRIVSFCLATNETRESPNFNLTITGLHYDPPNDTLIVVGQANDRVLLLAVDPQTFAVTRSIGQSPPGVEALGAAAYDSSNRIIYIQILLNSTSKHVASFDVDTGRPLRLVSIPQHFFGFEYSLPLSGILALDGTAGTPTNLYLLNGLSGRMADEFQASASGPSLSSGVGFDPVTQNLAFSLFTPEDSSNSAQFIVVQTATLPFALANTYSVPADTVVVFPLSTFV